MGKTAESGAGYQIINEGTTMERKYITVCYYICEIRKCPEIFGINSEKVLSVSDCITDHEPNCRLCDGWNAGRLREEKAEYMKRFPDTETYVKMSEEITALTNECLFFIDGCFLRRKDAEHFYSEYFSDKDHALVSVTAEECDCENFGLEFRIDENTAEDTDGEFMGCDIIGWDSFVFHSFLCNALQKELTDARFNNFCLLKNPFDEVREMAEAIDGKGEPVDWTAVMIRRIK